MAKKHEQVQKPQEPQTTPQPTAPATPLELTDEELGQVTGGFNPQPDPPGKQAPRDPGL